MFIKNYKLNRGTNVSFGFNGLRRFLTHREHSEHEFDICHLRWWHIYNYVVNYASQPISAKGSTIEIHQLRF